MATDEELNRVNRAYGPVRNEDANVQAARDAALRRGVERLRNECAALPHYMANSIAKALDALLRAGEET